MKISKSNLIFVAVAAAALTLFVGADSIKSRFVNRYPRYTVGVVTEFNEYVRAHNNCIGYTYTVDGKHYSGKYRGSELPTGIKGKRIVVKFSNSIRRWSYPLCANIVPDSIQPPAGGWEKEPEF